MADRRHTDFDFESRQLLTSIIGFSEMLADPHVTFTPARRFEYAETVRACASVLAERLDTYLQEATQPPRR